MNFCPDFSKCLKACTFLRKHFILYVKAAVMSMNKKEIQFFYAEKCFSSLTKLNLMYVKYFKVNPLLNSNDNFSAVISTFNILDSLK